MQIPQILGQIKSADFIVYTACDVEYFDQFAKIFCASVDQVAKVPVHLHIFNPRVDQLDWCNKNNVSVTWEFVDQESFVAAETNIMSIGGEALRRTQVAIAKGDDKNIRQRMSKTYYACARFVRLANVLDKCPTIFACDVDAVVRKPIPRLDATPDFYIHQIFGSKARFLAGGLYLNPGAKNFVQQYADVLRSNIEQDILYWSIDQDVLDPIVPQFNYAQLPELLIDWKMREDSVVWTAKGARKNDQYFIDEQKKYDV